MFSKSKKGDSVWSPHYGWGKIIKIYTKEDYPLIVQFASRKEHYKFNGKSNIYDLNQSLFWNEFKIPEESFIKPLPKLKVNTEVTVWNIDENTTTFNAHFSHFDSNGYMHCFANGKTKWTSDKTVMWEHWKLNEKK